MVVELNPMVAAAEETSIRRVEAVIVVTIANNHMATTITVQSPVLTAEARGISLRTAQSHLSLEAATTTDRHLVAADHPWT